MYNYELLVGRQDVDLKKNRMVKFFFFFLKYLKHPLY